MLYRWAFATLIVLAPTVTANATDPVRVVASFTILANMTEQVAGERAEVSSLVGPDGDAHVFEPTPDHARRVVQADLIVRNGLGFEGWMDRLLDATDGNALTVRATAGIKPLSGDDHHGHHHHDGHHHGDEDPHAWLDVDRARLYVRNIRDGLMEADPQHADHYEAGAEAYLEELATLDTHIREELAAIPEERRQVMTSHAAFAYFEDAYGIRFHAPRGITTGDEPAASDVAHLVRELREKRIAALLPDNLSDDRLLRRMASEADMDIAGTLYSDALSPADGPAPTYSAMMRHNASMLVEALREE